MAEDNKKQKNGDNKTYHPRMFPAFSNPEYLLEKEGSLVKKHSKPEATADSSGFFVKQYIDLKKERNDIKSGKKKLTLNQFIDPNNPYKNRDYTGELREKMHEAANNYWRQKDKMKEGIIFDHDKDGHLINPISSKKEIKPAAIVTPVKRPSEAVMKKLTGKK
jgi:hypothetical protein